MTSMSIPPVPRSATASQRRRNRWFMLAALIVSGGAFAVIAASGINDNLVYYWTPTYLRAAGDKAYGATIRLGGMVSAGSIRHHSGTTGVEFDVIYNLSAATYRQVQLTKVDTGS